MQTTINEDNLDATGLACPLPLLKVKQWLATASPGQRLRVCTSDPGSARDIPRYIAATPHQLVSSGEQGGTWEAVLEAGVMTEGAQ